MSTEEVKSCCAIKVLPSDWQKIADIEAVRENPRNAAAIVLRSGADIPTDAMMLKRRGGTSSRGSTSSTEKLFPIDMKLWRNGSTLRVYFVHGSDALKARVMTVAKEWEKYANITFEMTEDHRDAQIRIGFYGYEGHYSYLGTDALAIPQTDITMNLDGLHIHEHTQDAEIQRVVLHEFGHALGIGHEHKRAGFAIPWDEPVVYDYYWRTQRWSRSQVDEQVFKKTAEALSSFSTAPDPASIMMYPIRQDHTIGDFQVGWNTHLSNLDKSGIADAYPGR